VPFGISFVLALFLNTLAIELVDREAHSGQLSRVYMLLCLSISSVILAPGAWAGAYFAEGYGSSPWKGAAVGVWMGTIAAIAVSLWAILSIGPDS
jgi:hypothetical protein